MWDDILLAAGDILLTLLPLPDSSGAEDYFAADVMETREETCFPGKDMS